MVGGKRTLGASNVSPTWVDYWVQEVSRAHLKLSCMKVLLDTHRDAIIGHLFGVVRWFRKTGERGFWVSVAIWE